jgi:hypothetical protein
VIVDNYATYENNTSAVLLAAAQVQRSAAIEASRPALSAPQHIISRRAAVQLAHCVALRTNTRFSDDLEELKAIIHLLIQP